MAGPAVRCPALRFGTRQPESSQVHVAIADSIRCNKRRRVRVAIHVEPVVLKLCGTVRWVGPGIRRTGGCTFGVKLRPSGNDADLRTWNEHVKRARMYRLMDD